MGYIGNQADANFSSIDKQVITGNGGTGYTLSHSVANANEIAVYVNNVRQDPGVAYTVNNAALTMTGAVANTDSFYVVFIGKAVQTKVPADNSVGSGKLSTNAVSSAKIAASAVTQAKVASEAINESKLQVSNAPTNGYFLSAQSGNTGGLTWAEASTTGVIGGLEQTYSIGGTNYKSHTFLCSGAIQVNGAAQTADIMIVAGGGAGGSWHAGGGGAGGMLVQTGVSMPVGLHGIQVGFGGLGAPKSYLTSNNNTISSSLSQAPLNGENSSAFGYVAIGGGAGGVYVKAFPTRGGSGGGGNGDGANTQGSAGGQPEIAGQGGHGGTGGYNHAGGGGGGKGGAGGNASSANAAGAGGVGLANNYRTGSNIFYAGGGGGGLWYNGTLAQGGNGGGGNGSQNTNVGTAATPGTANTGGGGGGAGNQGNVMDNMLTTQGGSGIVVIRYVVS